MPGSNPLDAIGTPWLPHEGSLQVRPPAASPLARFALLLLLAMLAPVVASAADGCQFQPLRYQIQDLASGTITHSEEQLTLPPRLRPTTSMVRFELPPADQTCWLLIDRVSLYGLTVAVDGQETTQFDFFRPDRSDRFASSGYAVELAPDGQPRMVTLTVTQLGVMSTRATVVNLETLLANERRVAALHTLTLIAPLLMALLVGLFWLRLRDRALAAYVGLLAALVLVTSSLDGTLYFFAIGAPFAALRSMAHIFLLSLFGFATSVFYREFLAPLDRSGERTFRVLAGSFAFTGVSSLLGIPVYSAIIQHVTTFSLMVAVPLLLWQAIRSYRAGHPLAGYFLIGWMIPLLVIPLRILAEYGVLEWGFFLRYAPRFGFMIEATVFALGLADRVLRVRIERDRAEQERARTERSLASYRKLAEADALTGLASRRALESELQRWDAEVIHGACLFIDLDRFKDFNDSHGHAEGDEALRKVSRGLRSVMPPDAHLARYGGEEIVALLPRFDLAAATALAEQARQALETSVRGPDQAPVTVSIGVAQRLPDESMAQTLIGADEALYRAKAAGRNRIAARD